MKNCMAVLKKKLNYHMTQKFQSCVYIQSNWKQKLEQIFVHPYHNSIAHNSQKVEIIQVSMADKWIYGTSEINCQEKA